MIVTRTASAAFTVEIETEAELRAEHDANLSLGGLRLVTGRNGCAQRHPPDYVARSVGARRSPALRRRAASDGIALAIDGKSGEIFARLHVQAGQVPETVAEDNRAGRHDREAREHLGFAFARSRRWRKLLLAVKGGSQRARPSTAGQRSAPCCSRCLRNPRLTVR